MTLARMVLAAVFHAIVAVVPVMAASPGSAGITNLIYIAVRPDAVDGNGTQADPRDAGTAEKLTAILSNAPPNSRLVFAPGVYLLRGAFNVADGDIATITNGVQIVGSGIDNTIFRLTGASNYTVAFANRDYKGSNYYYADFTLDMDMANNGGTNNNCTGINVSGPWSTVERVKVVNLGGRAATHPLGYAESFAISTISYASKVINCQVDRVYSGAISGIYSASNGVVQGCIQRLTPAVDNGGNRNGITIVNTGVISGNTIDNPTDGIYTELSCTNFIIANNVITLRAPNSFGINYALCSHCGYNGANGMIANNQVVCVAGSTAIRLASEYGYRGLTNFYVFGNSATYAPGAAKSPSDWFLYADGLDGLFVMNNVCDPNLKFLSAIPCSNAVFFNNRTTDGGNLAAPTNSALQPVNMIEGWVITNSPSVSMSNAYWLGAGSIGQVLTIGTNGLLYGATAAAGSNSNNGSFTNAVLAGATNVGDFSLPTGSLRVASGGGVKWGTGSGPAIVNESAGAFGYGNSIDVYSGNPAFAWGFHTNGALSPKLASQTLGDAQYKVGGLYLISGATNVGYVLTQGTNNQWYAAPASASSVMASPNVINWLDGDVQWRTNTASSVVIGFTNWNSPAAAGRTAVTVLFSNANSSVTFANCFPAGLSLPSNGVFSATFVRAGTNIYGVVNPNNFGGPPF